MRVAFSKPTSDAAEQDQLFSRFRDFGYVGLQLKYGQYGAFLDDPARFRGIWGDVPGVTSGLIFGGGLDESGQAALRRVIAFGAAVGSELVVFCHGLSRKDVTDDDLRSFARILTTIGREAADRGVSLSLHHHYDQPVMHRPDFMTFFAAADPGSVYFTVDTAHLVKSGIQDIAGILRDYRDILDNVHLKDFRDGEFVVLGRGQIDFGPIFETLTEIGYDGWLCADEESGSGLDDALHACSQFISVGLSSSAR